jgi:hypothetical protein
MKNITPTNNWITQFFIEGIISPLTGRAYFVGQYPEGGLFYVISYPVNKKTGRAWQAGRTEVNDFADKESAIDAMNRLAGTN